MTLARVENVYEDRATARVGLGGTPLMGYLTLRAEKGGTIAGTLVTFLDNDKYNVAFTRTTLEAEPTVGPSPFNKKGK